MPFATYCFNYAYKALSNRYNLSFNWNLLTFQLGVESLYEKKAKGLNLNSILTLPKEEVGINYHLSPGINTPITPDNNGICIYALVYAVARPVLYIFDINCPDTILLVGKFVKKILCPSI